MCFKRAHTGRMQKDQDKKKAVQTSKKNIKVMDVRCVPATYSNFVMLRDLAKKLCWEKEYMQAFHQLEHAAYILQAMNLKSDDENVLYGGKAADVLDDMACIMMLKCDYGKAHRYLMVRLQTLTGFDDPLFEDFVVDEESIAALSDTYSALFMVFNLQAVKMWCENDFPNALEAFKSALNVLERCCYITGNYVQIQNTRRNIACVLRSMKRGQEAEEYDAEIAVVNCLGALDGPYTDEDKIFYHPTHGDAPELYVPGCDASEMSSEENRDQIKALAKKVLDLRVETKTESVQQVSTSFNKKAEHAFQCLQSLAAMDYMRKMEDSDRAMQELLAEEEEDKQRALERKSSKNKKKHAKAKEARERKQDAERVVQELFQAQQERVGAKTNSDAVRQNAVRCMPPVAVCVSPPPVPVAVSPPPVSQESEIAAYLEHFICPISLEIMEDPVITTDGSSYERASIEAWFKKTDRDPLTNAIVASKVLIPNKALKSAILAARGLGVVNE